MVSMAARAARAGERIAAERGGVGAGDQLLGELRLGQQSADGHAARQGLGQRDGVGHDVPSAGSANHVPVRPMPVCTSSKISISLMLVGQVPQSFEIARRAAD